MIICTRTVREPTGQSGEGEGSVGASFLRVKCDICIVESVQYACLINYNQCGILSCC